MKIKSAEFVIGATGSESFPADGRPQVAFAGRSNVGKSSLLNALLERKNLVRVGSRPGKTVEINFFLVNGKFYFVDLPGYGYAKHSLKKREKLRRMILWYLSGREPIAAITVVIDARAGLKPFDRQMLELAREEKKKVFLAVNKTDKLNARELDRLLRDLAAEPEVAHLAGVFPVSAKTGRGCDRLRAAVLAAVA